MAVYKVIQDIEAEDKLLGPLTLKGFIYALTAGFLAFLNFKILVTSAIGNFRWPLLLVFGLPMLLFAVLASPLGREQPTEIWLLSRVRFFLKPKSRTWDQMGMSQLVTITVPKKPERKLVKELSPTEVEGRLKALAMTMDSRGWAVKNVVSGPGYLQSEGDSDRLIGVSNLPQQAPMIDIHPADDILDEHNSPVAQLFTGLIKKKDAEHKQQIADKVSAAASQPEETEPAGKNAAADDAELNKELAAAKSAFRSEHTGTKSKTKVAAGSQKKLPVTEEAQADKLELAQSGNDLSVASIEKLANRAPKVRQLGPNEVEISLH